MLRRSHASRIACRSRLPHTGRGGMFHRSSQGFQRRDRDGAAGGEHARFARSDASDLCRAGPGSRFAGRAFAARAAADPAGRAEALTQARAGSAPEPAPEASPAVEAAVRVPTPVAEVRPSRRRWRTSTWGRARARAGQDGDRYSGVDRSVVRTRGRRSWTCPRARAGIYIGGGGAAAPASRAAEGAESASLAEFRSVFRGLRLR